MEVIIAHVPKVTGCWTTGGLAVVSKRANISYGQLQLRRTASAVVVGISIELFEQTLDLWLFT